MGLRKTPRAWVLPLLLLTAGGAAPAPHDLHIAYGDMAVEDRFIAGRVRIFKDDLERALGPLVGADAVSLAPGTEADALVMAYLREHLHIEAGGEVLPALLLGSGEDELDREPVWWVLVQYEATSPLESFTVRNTLLFEVFGDQRNIFKFVRFPDQESRTYYFAPGEEEHQVRFP